jgi:hypothetical protein
MVGASFIYLFLRRIFLALSVTALNFFYSYVEKKVVLNCFHIPFNMPIGSFLNLKFFLCLKVVL